MDTSPSMASRSLGARPVRALLALVLTLGGCDKVADKPADPSQTGDLSPRDLNRRSFHQRPRVQRGGGAPVEAATDSALAAADSALAASAAPSASSASEGSSGPDERDRVRGLYVTTARADASTKGLDDKAWSAVDGVAIDLGWSALEPSEGKPDFSVLDAELARAVAHAKPVRLEIRATRAPAWLFAAGVKKVELASDAKGSDKVALAPPWDAVFIAKHQAFVAKLADHVRGVPGAYERVVAVGFSTGRLDGEGAVSPASSGVLARWQDAGYRPSKALSSYEELLRMYAAAFADKPVAITVPEAGAFPSVDEAGAVQKSGDDAAIHNLADFGAATFPKRFVLVGSGLSATSLGGPFADADRRGAMVGLALATIPDGKGARAACKAGSDPKPHVCSDDELAATLAHALELRARYVEIPTGDLASTKAVAGARAKLAAPHP